MPLPLPLDAAGRARACDEAFAVFEAIEQRAAARGVPVDARIDRGRNFRHALRELIAEVPALDRIVVPAAGDGRARRLQRRRRRLAARNAPGEVVVLRPGFTDGRRITGTPCPATSDQ